MEKQAMRTNLSLKEHLTAHVKYPATKAQILTACNNDETPELVLRAAEMHLKDKIYDSADEVLKDLDMS